MYISYAELVTQFSEDELLRLSDRERMGVVNPSVINEAIAFADDLIDGYLREKVALPLTQVPRQLAGLAADIARYRLYQDQPTDLVVQRYEIALSWLKDVAKGFVVLDTGTSNEPQYLSYSTPTAVFTRLVW